MLRQSTADRFLGVLGQSTADPEVERQHHFNIFMAITILLTIGIYFGAYWIGHALWAGEIPEDQGVTGGPLSTDGLPWTPFNALSEENLTVVASAFLWLTVCITGFGSELVLGEWFVQKLSEGNGTVLWHASQLLFSLCISISIYSATALGLPFAVVGLWKFGFPETIGAYRRAFLDGASVDGLKEFMNGLGATLHHTSAAWLIVGITTGLFVPMTREIMAVSLPLVGQHMGVLVKYHNLWLYALINLFLEIWWEWEVFQQQQQLTRARGHHVSVHGCSLTMLFAHWLYWGAALLEIPKLVLGTKRNKTTQKVEELDIANNHGKTLQIEEVPHSSKRERRSTFDHLRSTANAYSSSSQNLSELSYSSRSRDSEPVACSAV